MFLYWPIVLVSLSALVLFIPAPILYHRSREWWAYSNVGFLQTLTFAWLILTVSASPGGIVPGRV